MANLSDEDKLKYQLVLRNIEEDDKFDYDNFLDQLKELFFKQSAQFSR